MRKYRAYREKLVSVLRHGGVAVLPTDTIYGILGSALAEKTVERIYIIRERQPKKPCIMLIADMTDIARFGVHLSESEKCFLNLVWPGKVSVVLPCPHKRYAYLHRGTKTLAFRVPRNKWLRDILRETGPLIAPSANPEGSVPAETIRQAKSYFGGAIDLYMSAGRRLQGKASTVVSLDRGEVMVLREGAGRVNPRRRGQF